MKIAITATGPGLDYTIDTRFGRCAYFVIYNTDNEGAEFLPNPNKDAQEGAGPASVQLIASHQVSMIISGEFGIKIKSLLDSLKIQMIVLKDPEKKIQQIIEMIHKQHQ